MQFSPEISVTLSLPYLYEIMAAFSFMSKRYIHSNRLENVHRKRERMISGLYYVVYHPTCQEISCLVVWYWDHFLLLKEVSTQQETSNRADYIRVIIQVTWWYTKVDETSSSSFLLKTYFFKGSLPINLAEIWLGKALLERWIHSRIYGVVIYNKKRQMTATAAFRRRGWNNDGCKENRLFTKVCRQLGFLGD